METMQRLFGVAAMIGTAVVAGAIGLRLFQMETRELLLTILVFVLALGVTASAVIYPVAYIVANERRKEKDPPRPAKGQASDQTIMATQALAALDPSQREVLARLFLQQAPGQGQIAAPQVTPQPAAPPPVVVQPLRQMKIIGGEREDQ